MCVGDISSYKVNFELLKDEDVEIVTKSVKKNSSAFVAWKVIESERTKKIFSHVSHGTFWGIVLCAVCPLFGVGLLALTLFRSIRHFLGKKQNLTVSDRKSETKQELAVFITGCDRGFGQGIALDLAEKGYHVFAGCLSKAGIAQYDDFDSITAVKLDVTKDEDPLNAISVVEKWLQDPSAQNPRFLHSVVNNAGVGSNGPIDWTSISDFENVMEVNYFGMIRTTKAILPILKRQACTGIYKDARILNVCSFAGHIALPGSPAYVVSKFAVERFSSCLRMEMKSFDLPVVTVNPSVHGTTMLDTSKPLFHAKWEKLSEEVKNEYGEESYNKWINMLDDVICVTWEAQSVIDQVANCIELLKPPLEVIVGMDAKYVLIFFKMLPPWLGCWILSNVSPVSRCSNFESKSTAR